MRSLFRLRFFVLILLGLIVLGGFVTQEMLASSPKYARVVLISIDGMGSSEFQNAPTPFMDKLVEEGTYIPYATAADWKNVEYVKTLPTHARMVTGKGQLPPNGHLIVGNPLGAGSPLINGPTLFCLTESSLMIAGKDKFKWLDSREKYGCTCRSYNLDVCLHS